MTAERRDRRETRDTGQRRDTRDRRGARGRRGGRPRHNRHICAFCVDKTEIDYKSTDTLRDYLTPRGHIIPRRRTGTCAKHQRQLSRAVKRSRHLALLPHAPQHTY
jgi:small subunit ribosomal protein S18